MNKVSGGDGTPVELFQTQKMMLWKCCTQYASKFGKLSRGHRTGMKSVFLLIPKRSNAKNVQVQFSSGTLTLFDPMDCSTPGFPFLHQLLKLAQTQVHWVGDAIQPSHSLSSLLLLPSVFPSIRVFSSESVLRIRGPKYWSFSISAYNEYSGLTSFRIDWLDLLAVLGTLKSLLRHHSSKASILWHSNPAGFPFISLSW